MPLHPVWPGLGRTTTHRGHAMTNDIGGTNPFGGYIPAAAPRQSCAQPRPRRHWQCVLVRSTVDLLTTLASRVRARVPEPDPLHRPIPARDRAASGPSYT